MRVPLRLAILLIACRRPPAVIDLRCDQILPSVEGRDWTATLHPGTSRDSALLAATRGRLVLRAFARADSTPLPGPLHARAQVAPTAPPTLASSAAGIVTLDLPAGRATVRTIAVGRASALIPVDVITGRVDTLDLYLAPERTNCDSTGRSTPASRARR